MILSRCIKKVKEATKEEVKESIQAHKAEIFCAAMAIIAFGCLLGVRAGPRPNRIYVTVNLRGDR